MHSHGITVKYLNLKIDDFRDSLWRFTIGFGSEVC